MRSRFTQRITTAIVAVVVMCIVSCSMMLMAYMAREALVTYTPTKPNMRELCAAYRRWEALANDRAPRMDHICVEAGE